MPHRTSIDTNKQPASVSIAMKSSNNKALPRRSSLDAQSGLSASSSSLFSEISWDDEVVAKHLGMSDKSLQDHLEYKKKDDTSSLSSATATTEGVDSFGADAESATEKDVVTNTGGSHTGITTCASRRMRPRASIRESIVSLSGTVLESIRECDDSSDEETTHHQPKGASITFAMFEPQPDDASTSYGSEGSLQFDDIFGPGATEDEDAKKNDPKKVIVSNDSSRSCEDDTPNAEDAAAVSGEFNESSHTKVSTSSTSSIKGSTSISASRSSSKSSKPDPPEAPWLASKIPHHMHGSASSLRSDTIPRQAPTKKIGAANSSNGAFEITDVYIPQDVADASSMFDAASGVTNKDLPTIPSHFTSSPNDDTTSDNDKVPSSSGIPILHREDSDGNIISGIINNLKTKLSKASDDANAEPATRFHSSSPQDHRSRSEVDTSDFLDIVKDVKLELANINMMMDSYRMKQRHLSEENQQLLKRQAIFEKQIESLKNVNCELQSQLQMSRDAIQAKEEKLQESTILQTKLRIELDESQRLLEKASESEQQANLTMMNMMHHKNNASTTEFLDFASDIDKLRIDDDGGTARTDDLTQEQVGSKRSLFSSIASSLGAEGSSRNIRQDSNLNIENVDAPAHLPEGGLLRRLSNMFAQDKGEEASSSSKGEFVPASNGEGSTAACPERYSSEDDTSLLPDETQEPVSRSKPRLSRRHSDEPLPCVRSSLSINERAAYPRRASVGFIYSSKGTRSLLPPSPPPDDKDQIEGTMSLNTAPSGRRLQKKTDSVRSINTQNDVLDFMTDFAGNASASTFHSDLGSIPEQDEDGVWAGNKCA